MSYHRQHSRCLAEEGEERLREAKRGVGGGEHAEVEGKGKGKSKGMSGKRGGAERGRQAGSFGVGRGKGRRLQGRCIRLCSSGGRLEGDKVFFVVANFPPSFLQRE